MHNLCTAIIIFPQVQPPSELKLVEASKVFSSDSNDGLGREDVAGASDVNVEDPSSADTEALQAKRDGKHSGTAHATTCPRRPAAPGRCRPH